jgi:hypothetical protein
MRINGKILIAIVGFLIVAARSMRINGKILIAIVGFVILAAAGALGLDKLGGFAPIKEFYPRNAQHQATAADVVKDVRDASHQAIAADVAKDVQDASHQATADVAKDVQDAAQQATAADVAKDVQTMKHETRLPKALDDYTELVDIRADGQAVVFVHRLTFEAEPSKAYQFLAAVRTNMLRPVCSQQRMAKAMNQGVVFRYQYDDVAGLNVGSFDIGGNDCAGI